MIDDGRAVVRACAPGRRNRDGHLIFREAVGENRAHRAGEGLIVVEHVAIRAEYYVGLGPTPSRLGKDGDEEQHAQEKNVPDQFRAIDHAPAHQARGLKTIT